MFRLLAAIFLLNVVFMLTDGLYEGGGGVQATTLEANITASSTNISANTTGFVANQTVTIGQEEIYITSLDATHFYTSTLFRGYNDTEAVEHTAGAIIYTSGAALVNAMSNYDITTTETGGGASGESEASVISVDSGFWSRGIPKMFAWNYGIFESEQLKIIRYCLMGICGILTAIIAMNMLPFVNFG